MFFWVEYWKRSSGTVQGKDEDEAREIASRYGSVSLLKVIPYPAEPKIYVESSTPSFCWKPIVCRGRTCCPNDRSCSS